jgi:glucose/mannose-6-phosphate isomerase
MKLDRSERFAEWDPENMLAEIDALPDHLGAAWKLGQELPLPDWDSFEQVVLAGMGGSAIGADLLGSYAAGLSRIPVSVWRNYDLPAYVTNEKTLVITCSHSGNTEETLSAFDAARERGARIIAVTTGGELARRAEAAGVPLWLFEYGGQPRAAVGYSFGLLLAAFSRLGVLPDPSRELEGAIAAMRAQQESIHAQSPLSANIAKRLAGQLMGRWPTIIGADFLAPVARRWRTQIAELAKSLAQFEELPEADHNLVAGVDQPEEGFRHTMVIFLQASKLHPRNHLRTRVSKHVLMLEGFNTDMAHAAGDSILAQQWTLLHFGDYTAYYLAMCYEIDPTPVPAIESLKKRLIDPDV